MTLWIKQLQSQEVQIDEHKQNTAGVKICGKYILVSDQQSVPSFSHIYALINP